MSYGGFSFSVVLLTCITLKVSNSLRCQVDGLRVDDHPYPLLRA